MVQLMHGRTPEVLLMSRSADPPDAYEAHLRQAGWRTRQISDPVETLRAVRSGQIDLVFLHISVQESLDMDLPNVLRRICPTDYLPVMIVASDVAEQERCQYLDSGADEVICEKTSPAEMIARAGALLRIKELNDQLCASHEELQLVLDRERKLLTELRRDNAYLQTLCTTDPLTHLQNVRAFRELMRHEYKSARRYNHPLSLLMLDIDHFKVVNDTHGHPSGDYVLKELAVILKRAVRDSDVVARTGGEEFIIILPKAGLKEAQRFADRIRREAYKREFIVYGDHIHITLSIGVATYPHDAEIVEPEMLVYLADQALLEAKETGRDRVIAVSDLSDETRRRLQAQYKCNRQAMLAEVPEDERHEVE